MKYEVQTYICHDPHDLGCLSKFVPQILLNGLCQLFAVPEAPIRPGLGLSRSEALRIKSRQTTGAYLDAQGHHLFRVARVQIFTP
jgi:hypothetical protein